MSEDSRSEDSRSQNSGSDVSKRAAAQNLEQQRKRAKDLLSAARANDPDALARIHAHVSDARALAVQLADAQLTIAREAGFESWPKLVKELEQDEFQQAAAALHSGDADRLRRILHSSPSVRKRINDPIGPFGSRPIHMAAENRAMLDVLLDAGADINLRSDWKNGPYSVLDSAPDDIARHLLTRGATLTANAAARLGWLDKLQAIVKSNPAAVHERGGDGQQPLHQAKTVEIADYLLDHGANIDERCIDHRSTPAQYALVDRPDVCRRLLERGATADIFMAARLGDPLIARRLIDDYPASVAARTYCTNYPPVPKMGIYAWTLGFLVSAHETALRFGNQEVYEFLMKNSPPNVRFLDAAMRADEPAARSVLRDDPRLPGSLTTEEQSFVALAAFHHRTEATILMLKLGFDPNARGEEGGTVLHAACWLGSVRIVEALLADPRVDVNLPDPTHGSPPLGWAALGSVMRCAHDGEYVGVVERLVAGGADVKRMGNGKGVSLLQMAKGNLQVQEALRRLGAG